MKGNYLLVIFIAASLITLISFSIDVKPKINENIDNMLDDKVIRYLDSDIKEMISKKNDFNDFYLLFDNINLNTNNMIDILSFFQINKYEYKIKEIYPYINPLFKDRLKEVSKLSFYDDNLGLVVNNLYKDYADCLRKNNLDDEYDKCNIWGINIRMIKINTSNQAMHEFLQKYNKVNYSLNRSGPFKTY